MKKTIIITAILEIVILIALSGAYIVSGVKPSLFFVMYLIFLRIISLVGSVARLETNKMVKKRAGVGRL